jgi:hypothetical protein
MKTRSVGPGFWAGLFTQTMTVAGWTEEKIGSGTLFVQVYFGSKKHRYFSDSWYR